MSNPVFDNSAIFGDPRKRPRGRAPQGTVATASSYGTATAGYDAASLNQLYEAPSATTADTGRLTYDDVIMKTAGLLAVLVLTGAATWILAPGLWIAGAVVGLVLGMVNAFKKSPSPALILLYAAAEGVFLVEYIRRSAVSELGAKTAEIGWILDDNQGMRAIADAIDSKVNREYFVYEKPL